ncbi:MAG: 5-formyltetrahydrofolate cyclo-ligase [Candidatus Manganitrophaceae bacterium]
MESSESKKKIRFRLLRQRKAHAPEECRLKSRMIAARLFASPAFDTAKTVHFYLAAPAEVQTEEMIAEALRRKKRVVVPIAHPETGLLTLSELSDFQADFFRPGPYGIPELRPDFRKEVDAGEVDLWVIPGVAFDRLGNRLGFGGGYYDRLLSGLKGEKIGVAFEFQLLDRLPVVENDHPVDQVITEATIIHCQKGEGRVGKTD